MNIYDMLIRRSRGDQPFSFPEQTLVYVRGVSRSATLLTYHGEDVVFSASSLPTGFTLSSAGVLAYDGTTMDPGGYDFSVTAVSGEDSITSTVTASVLRVPADYDWYTPFDSDFTEVKSGITGVPGQENAFSIVTRSDPSVSGYLKANKTTADNIGLEYPDTKSFFKYGTGSFAISYWARTPNWTSNSQLMMGTKQGDGYNGFVIFKDWDNPDMDVRIGTNYPGGTLRSPTIHGLPDWHHYVFQREEGGNWGWYMDGVLATNGTGATGSATQTSQNFKVGGGQNWTSQAIFDLAQLRIYGRALTQTEITALSEEYSNQTTTVRFWAGVNDTLIISSLGNGILKAINYGGTGYASDLAEYPEIYFYPKHGLKYSLDGGTTWQDWIFEDTDNTLDLSGYGFNTVDSVTKISGRDTAGGGGAGHSFYIQDTSTGASVYVIDTTSNRLEILPEYVPSSSSSSEEPSSSSEEPQPVAHVTYLPKKGIDTSIETSGLPKATMAYYFVERGGLYHATSGSAGSATRVGSSDGWTMVTEYIERQSTSDYECHAYGICEGTLYRLDIDGTATSLDKACDLVAGYYMKYKTLNNNTWAGLANCSDGLYRLASGATKINDKHDWVELSGGVYNYSSAYHDEAMGIDSEGTLYRIAYDGTLTQVATDIGHVTGIYRNGDAKALYGSHVMSGSYALANRYAMYINGGALYYRTTPGSSDQSGTLIDNTGTWTAIYGDAYSATQGYGIRDGKVCSVTTSGYTDTGYYADGVGYGGWHVRDGLVYNHLDARLTNTVYGGE